MAVSVSSGRYSKFPKVNREFRAAVPASEVVVDSADDEAEALRKLLADLHAAAEAAEAGDEAEDDGEVSEDEVVKTHIDVPALSVKKLVEWVGDDEDRRQAALEAELAGENRSTAIKALTVV